MALEQRQALPFARSPWHAWLAPAAIGSLALAVLAKAAGSAPYELVLVALFAAAGLLAAQAWLRPSVDPFAGPVALKIGILAVTIFLQPSLIGRDPHFELAVTERLIELGTWEPGLGLASQKAAGYSHYPGLSFVAATFAILTGLEPIVLARVLPALLALLGLVLVVAIAREVLGDDRRAAWVGIAWAAFWMTNIFQAEYVHESLGFPLFLAGVLFLFRSGAGDWGAVAGFVFVAGALVLTHHLSTSAMGAFLLLFLACWALMKVLGRPAGSFAVLVPAGILVAFAVGYNLVFGDPSVFGYLDAIRETMIGTAGEGAGADPGAQPGPGSGPTTPTQPADTYTKQAVFYERQGFDQVIYDVRIGLSVVLIALTLANLAWRALDRSLDARWLSLVAWSGFVFTVALLVTVANVTVGLDPPRLLPWAFVFLLVTAADVPGRERLRSLGQRWRQLTPRPRSMVALVGAVLLVFAGFQLVVMPPHLLTQEEEPAYYRGQVRNYYHADEQAMATWVDDEIDDGTEIFGDQTAKELVAAMDHGEVLATGTSFYRGESEPSADTYIIWREEMTKLYLGLESNLEPAFFPVPEERQRSLESSDTTAKLYASPRTGVYLYDR